ncbi:hypothetical protein [Paracidovorax oryzae]|uniref:hypothetical protein n=1 Tax=Paracidovorax oryzae TaxID=862720 RepID=UPI0012FE9336|nr:hypothetical protein [Paracidovorax oryzae]
MHRKAIFALLLCVTIFAVVCLVLFSSFVLPRTAAVLEYKDVADLNVRLIEGESEKLKLSGLVLHGSLGAKTYESKVEGDKAYLKIVLAMAGEKVPGRFLHEFEIDRSINYAYFGDSKVFIWSRSALEK